MQRCCLSIQYPALSNVIVEAPDVFFLIPNTLLVVLLVNSVGVVATKLLNLVLGLGWAAAKKYQLSGLRLVKL